MVFTIYSGGGGVACLAYVVSKARLGSKAFPMLNVQADSHKYLRPIRDEGGWRGMGLGFQLGTACRDSCV